MVHIAFLCLTVLMLLIPPLLETRSHCIVDLILLETVTALSAYEVNTTVYPMTGLNARSLSELVPPMTGESLRAVSVPLYVVSLDDRRNRVPPITMVVGAGFAVLENSIILTDNVGSVTVLWITARGFSTSLMYGLCTVMAGAGVTYVKKQKKLSYTGTFGLLPISITMYALFSLLIQSDYDYIGMAMSLVLYGLTYWLHKEQRVHPPFQGARSTGPSESGYPGASRTYREHGSTPGEPTSVLDPTMAGKVLPAIRASAREGFTMLIATHETKFARGVSSRIFYMGQGELYEDSPPEQVFGHPEKEHTRAFVKGPGVFEQETTSRHFDCIEIDTAIKEFGRRQVLSQRHTNNIELAFEELCVQTLLGCIGDEICLGFVAEMPGADESYLVTATYGGNVPNLFMDCTDSLFMVLLSKMVCQYSHHFQNGNSQMNLYL